jgi:RimJ/RimL family protein N-acetyltransferase
VYERAPEPAETSESEPESETSLRSRNYEPRREKIERRYSSGQASARSSGGIRGSTRQDSAFGSYGDVTSPSKVVSVAASAAARLREIEADRTRRRAAEEESELRRRAREIADRTRHRREEDEERKRQRAAAAAASDAAEGAAGGGGSAAPKPAPTAAKIVSGAVIHSSRLDFRRPVASVDTRAGEILRDDPDLPKLSALTDAQFTRWRERTRDDWDSFGDDSNSTKSRDQSPATCVFDVFERSSGAMIGVAGFHVLDLDAKRAYLVVVIDGDRRRRGYGRECWETVSKFAKSDLAYHLGVETVCARVPTGNEPALFFVKDTRGFASPFSSPTGRGGGVNAQVFRRRTLATQAGKTPGLKRSLDDPDAPVFGVNASEVGTCQTFYLDVRYWGGGAA